MGKEKSKIFVKELNSDTVLFECSLEESEKAFQYAAELEQMGIEVIVSNPTLTDTLSNSLGVSDEALTNYKQDLQQEMDSHSGGCCFEDSGKKNYH